jgi:hypothetical protein
VLADSPLWAAGQPLAAVDLDGELAPRLASWNRATDPEAVRLRRYLELLAGAIGQLPAAGLYLAMEIGVPGGALLRGRDVENYLKPVVQHLGWQRFVLARGVKRAGGHSRLMVGFAAPSPGPSTLDGWHHFDCAAGSGHDSTVWKSRMRGRLAAAGVVEVPAGPVEVQLAWTCSAARNWSDLWKPTADAMGPLLGARDTRRPYDPDDDRIVSLALHRRVAPDVGWEIGVDMWWRPAAGAGTGDGPADAG